jgi:hypothetical protein
MTSVVAARSMIAKRSNITIALFPRMPTTVHSTTRPTSRAPRQYLGKLPDDQFKDAARNAYSQAAPQERQGLLGALGGAASGGLGDIASKLGLGTTDPSRMSADDPRA